MIRTILTALRLRAMIPPADNTPALIASRAERVRNRNRAAASAYIATHAVLARGPE